MASYQHIWTSSKLCHCPKSPLLPWLCKIGHPCHHNRRLCCQHWTIWTACCDRGTWSFSPRTVPFMNGRIGYFQKSEPKGWCFLWFSRLGRAGGCALPRHAAPQGPQCMYQCLTVCCAAGLSVCYACSLWILPCLSWGLMWAPSSRHLTFSITEMTKNYISN